MPLEPTDAQVAEIVLLTTGRESRVAGRPGELSEHWKVRLCWPLIRDMVLEEAAKACESGSNEGPDADPYGVGEKCAAAVRALKGAP